MLRSAMSRRAIFQAMTLVLLPSALPWTDGGGAPEPEPQDVSPVLMQAICAHCVAFSQVRRLAREMASGAKGQSPSTASPEALSSAVETERRLWASLVSYKTRNEAERHDKAAYVLGLR